MKTRDMPIPPLRVFAGLRRASGFSFSRDPNAPITDSGCLWPAPYNKPTLDAFMGFLSHLRTWNEAERALQHFPDKGYIAEVAKLRIEARKTGDPLILEKSRRLISSWEFRALELHDLGLSRGNGIITHFTNEDASEHCWRIWHLYEDLRLRYGRKWDLPPAKPYGRLADQQLDSVVLPNGSKVDKHYEQPKGLQGSGFAWVTCEELSLYRRPAAMFTQAQFVTQASAAAVNGLVVVVTNASPNPDWQLLKGVKPAMG
jgi:hypothetical protein